MEASTSLREFLQQNGLRPEEKWEDRGAAIHMAVSSKLPSHASELLNMYPQDCVNAKDERGLMRGRVPLHNAAQLGLADVVLKLLDLEADINARTWTGWTALLLATKAQQDAIVSILLARGADVEAHSKVDIKSGGRKSFTALHLAAEQQSPNAVLQLLHRGAKCDFTTSDGDTALHLAVRARCLPAAALLLLHGASSEVRNEVGISPRDLIMKFKRGDQQKFQHMLTCNTDDAAEQFLSCVDGNVCSPNLPNAIHRAAADGKVGAIIYLLHMNPRLVVAKNEVGWQPLHTAARVGSPEAARTLLKHGAELDCLTKRKWTPVMLAVNYNRVSILRVLLEYHPNTMLRSSDGHDAMTLAKRHGDAMVGLLPSFRHVPSNQVPTEGKASPGARDNMLNVPGKPGRSRDPSPAQSESSELEGS
jgi:ankyrin